MKPVAKITQSRNGNHRSHPVVDFNYRSLQFDELKARCGGMPLTPFGGTSQDYVLREARRDFIIEAVGFVLITALTLPAIIDCARALATFMRAIGGI